MYVCQSVVDYFHPMIVSVLNAQVWNLVALEVKSSIKSRLALSFLHLCIKRTQPILVEMRC